eukprot:8422455-Pyramimonas_sp.AAC.1
MCVGLTEVSYVHVLDLPTQHLVPDNQRSRLRRFNCALFRTRCGRHAKWPRTNARHMPIRNARPRASQARGGHHRPGDSRSNPRHPHRLPPVLLRTI